jgi:CelD/BcsL family acetyltransferase involved in cellulose biosynthesis
LSWRFTWWTTWEEVAGSECQAAWQEVLVGDPFPHPFKQPGLALAWAETRGRALGAAARVGLAEHSCGARVLLPWAVVPHRGRRAIRRVLEPIGQSLFGYQDPVVAFPGGGLPGAAWVELWVAARRALTSHCDQALMRFLTPDSGQGPWSEPCSEDSPILELGRGRDLEALLATTSASHRGDVLRQLRRLGERGPLALWVAGAEDAGRAEVDFAARFVPAYRALWTEAEPGCLLDQPGMTDFLTLALARGLSEGWAHYAVLSVGGEPVAWHLGLASPSELYWWFPTYSLAWANFSPGKALLASVLERGLATGLSRIHFLTGTQPYKLAWKPVSLKLRTVRWYSPSLRGRLLSLYDRTRRP